MRRTTSICFVLAAFAGLMLVGSSGPADAQTEFGIVVIDTQRIYREATAVMRLQKHVDEERARNQEELRGKEESLRAAGQELERQRGVLTADVFNTRRRELEEGVVTLQREIQSHKRDLERLFARGMNQIRGLLVEISQEIAKEREVDIVLEKSAVVLVKPDLEITREALERLNQRLPQLDIATLKN
ncbi:MAG: OmpH family outer membrane protein [Kiloniellales bacterium]|nr:OmpH family outer membrane protein [Kiloniellales bacterium]